MTYRELMKFARGNKPLSRGNRLKMKSSYLWYAVQLPAHLELLPDDVARSLFLGHHRRLIHVHDEDEMLEFARKAADDGGWSVSRLEEHIQAWKAKNGVPSRRGGRPPEPAAVKSMKLVVRAMELGPKVTREVLGVRGIQGLASRARQALLELIGLVDQVDGELLLERRFSLGNTRLGFAPPPGGGC